MKRLTSFVFYHVARLISYGIAVALSSGISAILTNIFVIYFAEAIRIPVNDTLMLILFIFITIGWVMHSLHFGLLHHLGFSGFTSGIRFLNQNVVFQNGKISLRDDLSSQDYLRLLQVLRTLPVQNSLVALFWVVFIGVAFFIAGIVTETFQKQDYPIVLTLSLIAFFIHVSFSQVIGEIASGPLRSECKRILHNKKIDYEDKAITNVRLKLVLFMGLFAITLFVSNALTYSAVKEEKKLFSAIVFGAVAVMVAMLMTYLIFSIIYQSLKEIEAAAADLKKGGEGLLYPRSLDQEFVNVASGIISATKTIRDYQANLEKKVQERTRQLKEAYEELSQKDAIMQMELDFAAEIQKGIIPSHFPEWNGIRIAAHWKAMEKVSGDFYDVFPMMGNRYGVLMADVSGHGIPAALITTMAKVSFSKAAAETYNPSEIFQKVNDQLFKMINTQDYLTAFLLSIDESHHFLYSNASHQLAKLWRASSGEIELLDTGGLFIGAIEEAGGSYEEKENRLLPGDKIILYTDGIVEFRHENGEEYGHERMNGVLKEFGHLPADQLLAQLMYSLEEFAQGTAPLDDISILVLEADANYGLFLDQISVAQQNLEQGNRSKAAQYIEEALQLYPRNLNSLRIAGLVNYELGRIEKAAEYFQRYIELNTQNAEIYYWLATIHYKLERFELAVMYGRYAVNLRPNYTEAWNTLGLALAGAGHPKEAVAAFEKALQFDPDNETIRANLERVSRK